MAIGNRDIGIRSAGPPLVVSHDWERKPLDFVRRYVTFRPERFGFQWTPMPTIERNQSRWGTQSRWFRLGIHLSLSMMVANAGADPAGSSEFIATVSSPDGRNSITLWGSRDAPGGVRYAVRRGARRLMDPSALGPILVGQGDLAARSRVVGFEEGKIEESFSLSWGKCHRVTNRCRTGRLTLSSDADVRWQVELRAYDDGVAFRYVLLSEGALSSGFEIRDEATEFRLAGSPMTIANRLRSFTTSHESRYRRVPLDALPVRRLLDMPLLAIWPDDVALAITEARVRRFAGMYLERPEEEETTLRGRLSPLPSRKDVSVVGDAPRESPWRVFLIGDTAGKLLESNLLVCLNDPPVGDYRWVRPGKTTFHWWYGAFEDDHRSTTKPGTYFERHRAYIDFCARHKIAYHSVSGDGRAWYRQSPTFYGTPLPDADVGTPRPDIELPRILDYARTQGVGIRLWVHWKPLSQQLEEAFARYEAWGIQGLMVDFLDRDDQEMIEFTERLLECAARHKLHIQIHGSSKSSGEERTFPHLFNREGVLNLEYVKWSRLCTPQHSVDVAFTRALTGPVDYHLGGFRSASRDAFEPRDRAPEVLGTRCHHLALYVVYENPMPMVADDPSAYEGQRGFEFLAQVPTTWDETRFLCGEPGDYIVVARRRGTTWYLGGITNWESRDLRVPLDPLGAGPFEGTLYLDGSMDESQPNAIAIERRRLRTTQPLEVSLAPGGGFAAILGGAPNEVDSTGTTPASEPPSGAPSPANLPKSEKTSAPED